VQNTASCGRIANSSFFYGGGWDCWEFSYFTFFGVGEAPTIITTKADPLPPMQKIDQLSTGACGYCGQHLQVVDSIDVSLNAYKSLTESV
jgi:hypothetical protein